MHLESSKMPKLENVELTFFTLKGPKHEIFKSRFIFTQVRPVQVSDWGMAKKNEILQVEVFICWFSLRISY
jgi:hypothetical protein